MSVMSDLRKKIKKMSTDVNSSKDLDQAGKKKLQEMLDKVDEKLCDLAPRRDQLEQQILGIKTLEDEIKDYNRDQGSLKDNAFGVAAVVKDQIKKSPKAADLLKDVNKTADILQKLPDLKKN